jgi:hypothetical protein
MRDIRNTAYWAILNHYVISRTKTLVTYLRNIVSSYKRRTQVGERSVTATKCRKFLHKIVTRWHTRIFVSGVGITMVKFILKVHFVSCHNLVGQGNKKKANCNLPQTWCWQHWRKHRIRMGLIYINKENKKLRDWKECIYSTYSPCAPHTYDFVVLTSLTHPRKILLVALQIGR